jgi:hypothetical protein
LPKVRLIAVVGVFDNVVKFHAIWGLRLILELKGIDNKYSTYLPLLIIFLSSVTSTAVPTKNQPTMQKLLDDDFFPNPDVDMDSDDDEGIPTYADPTC